MIHVIHLSRCFLMLFTPLLLISSLIISECLPPFPPAPSALCNGSNWIIYNSVTLSALQVSDRTPLIVLGNLTLAQSSQVTVSSSGNGTTPIIVQNTVQISPDSSLVIEVAQLPSNPVAVMQAPEIKNSFNSVSFSTPAGDQCADQTTSGSTLLVVATNCDGGSSTGKIVGIVVGSVVGGAILVGVVVYVSRNVLHLAWTDVLFHKPDRLL